MPRLGLTAHLLGPGRTRLRPSQSHPALLIARDHLASGMYVYGRYDAAETRLAIDGRLKQRSAEQSSMPRSTQFVRCPCTRPSMASSLLKQLVANVPSSTAASQRSHQLGTRQPKSESTPDSDA